MSRSAKSLLLTDEIDLLVRHFGVQRVRAAIEKISTEGDEKPRAAIRKDARRPQSLPHNGTNVLDSIRDSQPEKYQALSNFFLSLKNRQLLPESQDIRYFAQIIGLKEIRGKSREDMVPKLVRFLMDQPIEKVKFYLEYAPRISEQQRRMGFSILTDKLVGKL